MTDDDKRAQKEIEYYSAIVQAWVATRMEKDRTLLALATGGIGLLATLMTTVGPSSRCELLLYAGAVACFLVAIGTAIFIFDYNAHYLESVTRGESAGRATLYRADTVLVVSFFLGTLLTAAVAVMAAYAKLGSTEVRNETKVQRVVVKVPGPGEQRSLAGIEALSPAPASPAPASGGGSTSGGGGATAQPAGSGGGGSQSGGGS